MLCPNCKLIIPNDSDFCQYCGTTIDNNAVSSIELPKEKEKCSPIHVKAENPNKKIYYCPKCGLLSFKSATCRFCGEKLEASILTLYSAAQNGFTTEFTKLNKIIKQCRPFEKGKQKDRERLIHSEMTVFKKNYALEKQGDPLELSQKFNTIQLESRKTDTTMYGIIPSALSTFQNIKDANKVLSDFVLAYLDEWKKINDSEITAGSKDGELVKITKYFLNFISSTYLAGQQIGIDACYMLLSDSLLEEEPPVSRVPSISKEAFVVPLTTTFTCQNTTDNETKSSDCSLDSTDPSTETDSDMVRDSQKKDSDKTKRKHRLILPLIIISVLLACSLAGNVYQLFVYNSYSNSINELSEAMVSKNALISNLRSEINTKNSTISSLKDTVETQSTKITSLQKSKTTGSAIYDQLTAYNYGNNYSDYYAQSEVIVVHVGEKKSLKVCGHFNSSKSVTCYFNRKNTNSSAEWGKNWDASSVCDVYITGVSVGTNTLEFTNNYNNHAFSILVIILPK